VLGLPYIHALVLLICLLMLVFILSYLFMLLCYSKYLLVALLLIEASIADTCGASDALLCPVLDPFGSTNASGALLCLLLDLFDPFDQHMLVARLQG
jgi:hypothetical protein